MSKANKKKEIINIQKVIDYWIKSAQDDFDTANFLFRGKKYPESLFFCHLAIEKIFKALVVKATGSHAPYTHQLVNLAKITKVDLTAEQIDNLVEITEFNIASRYDAYKFDFRKRCTKEYVEKYFKISKELFLWLKNHYYQQR